MSTPVLVERSDALPLVSVSVAFRAGATTDPEGKEGVTRLLSRLMRRTAGGLGAEELDVKIDSLGASLGTDTSHSSLSFGGTSIVRSLEAYLAIVEDVVARPGLAEDELGRLQRETEAAIIDARDDDRSLVRRWFRRKLFPSHAYARSVTGRIASVKSIGVADIRRQLELLATSENLVVAVAGDVDETRARAFAERLSTTLRRGTKAPETGVDPTAEPGRRLVFVDKPERTQTQILIGGLGTHPADEDHTALLVAGTIFGGAFTSRLMKEVRSKRGWSYGAYSSLPYDRRRREFSLWTFPKADDAAACIELEIRLLEAWIERGVTPRELSWAKRFLGRSHAFSIDTPSKRVGLALDEELTGLPRGFHAAFVERVQAVTLEQANEAIRRRISAENLLFTVVGTESVIGNAVREKIPNLAKAEVVAFDEDV